MRDFVKYALIAAGGYALYQYGSYAYAVAVSKVVAGLNAPNLPPDAPAPQVLTNTAALTAILGS